MWAAQPVVDESDFGHPVTNSTPLAAELTKGRAAKWHFCQGSVILSPCLVCLDRWHCCLLARLA